MNISFLKKIKSKNIQNIKLKAQDFGGYFSGDVPDNVADMIGTSNVDYSQISSYFSGTDKAIALVRQFDNSLLQNIVYIFNFTKAGAFGVYVDELDHAVKTKKLSLELTRKGYEVTEDNGRLIAFDPKGIKDTDDIQKEIDSIYQRINSGGGVALGLNMGRIVEVAEENARELLQSLPSEESYLKDDLVAIDVAATIAHEAVHAKGARDEGRPKQVENDLKTWALNKLNETRKSRLGDNYTPLQLGSEVRHAQSNGLKIKEAQSFAPFQMPAAYDGGSDLSGRHRRKKTDLGMADWSLIGTIDSSIPLEARLPSSVRNNLPREIDTRNDSLEEQLQKKNKYVPKYDTSKTTDYLLKKDHTETTAYHPYEELLEDEREKPLMLPLKQSGRKGITKVATLFGWYNNLEVSDGVTIPGLGDRVMLWEDRDESFAREEEWIRAQPRYNPEYDIKGFYYRWIEPRHAPYLFNDPAEDLSMISPARRFASNVIDTEEEVRQIKSIALRFSRMIKDKTVCAHMFVISEDLIEYFSNLLNDIHLLFIKTNEKINGDDIYHMWMYSNTELEDEIISADKSKNYEKIRELMSNSSDDTATSIMFDTLKSILDELDVQDFYLVGQAARFCYENNSANGCTTFNFCCSNPDLGIKVGLLLAQKLGVGSDEIQHFSDGCKYDYGALELFFSNGRKSPNILNKMEEHDISLSEVNYELCCMNFTINMIAKDIRKGKYKILFKRTISDIKNKILHFPFEIDGLPCEAIIQMLLLKGFGWNFSNTISDQIEDVEVDARCLALLQVAKDQLSQKGLSEEEIENLFICLHISE